MSGKANAAQCGSRAAGFETWKKKFAGEAQARVVSASTIAALMATTYSTATIAGQSKPWAIQKVTAAPSFSPSRSLRGLCEFCQVLRSSVRT
jgi:membrane-bound lytic murein transglycosylase B